MKGREYFISGIDTDCGKTYITGLLAKHLQNFHNKIITTKLIQTGCKDVSEDIKEHRKLMGVSLFPDDLRYETCPYVLCFPSSPHLAAKLENKTISIKKIRQLTNQLLNKYNIVLSEGVGGLMVPITENFLIADYIKKHNIPLILVSSSKLGSINHTLLNINFCIDSKLNLHSIIYNKLPDSDKIIAEDSFLFLKDYLKLNIPKVELIHSSNFLNEKLNTKFSKYLSGF